MANLILKSGDFDNIRNELIAYIRTKEGWADAPEFDGSNLSFIIDVESYVTQFLHQLAHASVNESFLDSTSLRSNMLSIAKGLGYIPQKTVPAQAQVQIQITDFSPVFSKYPSFNLGTDTLVLLAYSQFTATNNDETTTFYTLQDYTLSASNNWTNTVTVYEGTWTNTSLGTSDNSANQSYRLNVSNLTNYINLKVNDVVWTNTQDITEYESDSQYYQVFENYLETYDFVFGDGNLGEIPALNADIEVDYLISDGADGNGKSNFGLISSLYVNGNAIGANEIDNTEFTITTLSSSVGGKDKEDIEVIRKNAPKFYSSQKRAITKSDYDAILRQNSLVEYLNVWGGEEVNPPTYGFIYATIKPPGADTLTSEQKDSIVSYMDPYNIQGIRFRISDPVYLYVTVTVTGNYNLKTHSSADIISGLKNSALNYFDGLKTSAGDYQYSKLICALDETSGVINSRLSNRTYLSIESSTSDTYYFDLGQSIVSGSLDMTWATDTTKGWYDSSGVVYNRNGDTQVGTIDYTNGIITITDYDEITTNTEKCYIEFEVDDVEVYQNVVLRYDETNSSFTANGVSV